MNDITVEELKSLLPKTKIIDIRDKYQFNLGHIPTAINIPMNFIMTNPENYLEKNEIYYICCEYGSRSKHVSEFLVKKGYNCINILGGYNEYNLLSHKK